MGWCFFKVGAPLVKCKFCILSLKCLSILKYFHTILELAGKYLLVRCQSCPPGCPPHWWRGWNWNSSTQAISGQKLQNLSLPGLVNCPWDWLKIWQVVWPVLHAYYSFVDDGPPRGEFNLAASKPVYEVIQFDPADERRPPKSQVTTPRSCPDFNGETNSLKWDTSPAVLAFPTASVIKGCSFIRSCQSIAQQCKQRASFILYQISLTFF